MDNSKLFDKTFKPVMIITGCIATFLLIIGFNSLLEETKQSSTYRVWNMQCTDGHQSIVTSVIDTTWLSDKSFCTKEITKVNNGLTARKICFINTFLTCKLDATNKVLSSDEVEIMK